MRKFYTDNITLENQSYEKKIEKYKIQTQKENEESELKADFERKKEMRKLTTEIGILQRKEILDRLRLKVKKYYFKNLTFLG